MKRELEVIVQGSILIVIGNCICNMSTKKYLYCGIIKQNFKYQFGVSEHFSVERVNLTSGLLNIYLKCFFDRYDFFKSHRIEIKNSE